MVIEEKDFRLTPVKDTRDKFDLEILRTINKGKKNERQEFKAVAYGVSIEYALRYVANIRIVERNPATIDLKTYLQEYRNILAELKKLCES